MKRITSFALIAGMLGVGGILAHKVCRAKKMNAIAAESPIDYLDLDLETIDGNMVKLSDYHGKVLLLVNTASKCGFTKQYAGLQELYEKYKDRGLVVIGFPANNFLGQEPGSNDEIATFCETNYGVTFPMMAKISVKGKDIHPLYQYLTTQSPYTGDISWNFNKFLLNREGQVINRFGSKQTPMGEDITKAVESALQ